MFSIMRSDICCALSTSFAWHPRVGAEDVVGEAEGLLLGVADGDVVGDNVGLVVGNGVGWNDVVGA